jgi:hypothetical protein
MKWLDKDGKEIPVVDLKLPKIDPEDLKGMPKINQALTRQQINKHFGRPDYDPTDPRDERNQGFVLNKRTDVIPEGAIYIGRGSMWGNPYIIGRDGNRSQVIHLYQAWLDGQINTRKIQRSQIMALHGKTLVCYCKPLACHGDSLVWLAGNLTYRSQL